MRIVEAKLIKHRTEDGLAGIFETVPLGKVYQVDIDSRQTIDLYNHVKGVPHQKEIIQTANNEGWLPAELLEMLDA